MIPRTIHYCWFGPDKMTPLMRRCLDSWRRHLPEYAFRLWNETNTPLDAPYFRQAIAKGRWAKIANITRLDALHAEGGIYLDTDVELLRPLDPLLAHDCFLGFQKADDLDQWVNNAVMGARAGHPFLLACRDRIVQEFEGHGKFPNFARVASNLLREMGLSRYGFQEVGGVTLYPVEAFYPFDWTQLPEQARVTPDTYTVHYWNQCIDQRRWHRRGLNGLRRIAPPSVRKAGRALLGKIGIAP